MGQKFGLMTIGMLPVSIYFCFDVNSCSIYNIRSYEGAHTWRPLLKAICTVQSKFCNCDSKQSKSIFLRCALRRVLIMVKLNQTFTHFTHWLVFGARSNNTIKTDKIEFTIKKWNTNMLMSCRINVGISTFIIPYLCLCLVVYFTTVHVWKLWNI